MKAKAKKNLKTVKKAKTAKSKCAAELGRKGGLATKRKKVGIFSAKYKRKATKKKK